jgi:MIP family channel proteins
MDQGFRSYWAEFLGTFTLCFIGQGAILTHLHMGEPGAGLLAIAVAHGLALAVMISAFGAVSGGHLNPAVTMGFLVTGRQTLPSAVAYWVAQVLGAIVASYFLKAIYPASIVAATHLGAPALNAEVSLAAGAGIEFILTFLLITAVWGTAVDERAPRIGGFGIGLTVLMGILMAGPLTGGAMNPARTIGPMLASGFFDHLGVYVVAQLAGGAAAALVYKNLVLPKKA